MIEYIDSGLIIFFLGVIIYQARDLRKQILVLRKFAYKTHPEIMSKIDTKNK